MLLLMLVFLGISIMWGNGEVMKDKQFTCTQFFYKGEQPSGLEPSRSARICQTYKKKVHFATLYDRDNLIPIYSAYKYNRKTNNITRNKQYYYEPQCLHFLYFKLVNEKYDKEMKKIPKITTKIKKSQAVSEDYKKENMNISSKQYDRGHLSPIVHHPDLDSKTATCTLTNIVPQFKNLNAGQWNYYEKNRMEKFTNRCSTTYVIVGVIPGKNYTYTHQKKRVNVPSHIWTAACCVNEKGTPVRFLGYIAENDKNVVNITSLTDLLKRLKIKSGRDVTLFNGGCKRNRNTFSHIF
uniref:Endonuclease domain-containing 1 protein n=1 Tax=Erpetoichthys calabaricus TaxID=27687 RepID=A0A8C4RHQ3_ERPCA